MLAYQMVFILDGRFHQSECHSIVPHANHIMKLGYCHMLQWNQTNIDKHQE